MALNPDVDLTVPVIARSCRYVSHGMREPRRQRFEPILALRDARQAVPVGGSCPQLRMVVMSPALSSETFRTASCADSRKTCGRAHWPPIGSIDQSCP